MDNIDIVKDKLFKFRFLCSDKSDIKYSHTDICVGELHYHYSSLGKNLAKLEEYVEDRRNDKC